MLKTMCFLNLFQIYNEAEKCLKTLSDRLGESEYFFGNRPSSFDATVFAYLAPLAKAPFPNATLSNHVKGIVNLNRFVGRISQKNFRNVTDGRIIILCNFIRISYCLRDCTEIHVPGRGSFV